MVYWNLNSCKKRFVICWVSHQKVSSWQWQQTSTHWIQLLKAIDSIPDHLDLDITVFPIHDIIAMISDVSYANSCEWFFRNYHQTETFFQLVKKNWSEIIVLDNSKKIALLSIWFIKTFKAKRLQDCCIVRDHPFSTYTKFSVKVKFLTSDTHIYVCVSEGKKYYFYRKFCVCTKWMILYLVCK